MNKVYVIIRKTPFFTEIYKVCESMDEAERRVRGSVYPARDFTIVESEFIKAK